MTTLFDKLKIGTIELSNRIIMSPMTRSRADDEGVQPEIAAEYYRQRASAGSESGHTRGKIVLQLL